MITIDIYFALQIIHCLFNLQNRIEDQHFDNIINQLYERIQKEKTNIQFKNDKIIPSLTNSYEKVSDNIKYYSDFKLRNSTKRK